jgi:hypothetical protein
MQPYQLKLRSMMLQVSVQSRPRHQSDFDIFPVFSEILYSVPLLLTINLSLVIAKAVRREAMASIETRAKIKPFHLQCTLSLI